MLEKVDLSKKLSKDEYRKYMDELTPKLAKLQRDCRELGIPVMVIFEGLDAAGKGTLINQLIQPLDPRGFKVFNTRKETEEERYRPFLWRFWTKIPELGRIAIFDRSWYRRVLEDRVDGIIVGEQVQSSFGEIVSFEEQLTDYGMVIVKIFLHISKKEQKKRFDKLEGSKETKWRVTAKDWERHKVYDYYVKINDEMLEKTDTDFANWNIVEGTDKRYATVKIISTVVDRLDSKVKEVKISREKVNNRIEEVIVETNRFKTAVLAGIDLSKSLTKEEYKKKLKSLQSRLSDLHNEMYLRRIPVILAFEGWDAGGKGGAIKRITECIDPRGYEVVPTAAPNDIERKHHYLWRFWNTVPKAGHMTIYDRTWYGRVMVERIEGFCSREEWQRAYTEINRMEEHISNSGVIILKFWLHIDKNEQERRFKERQETPDKQWKITEEDWRNRAKWDEYETAVDEMIIKTSTTYAPWIVVEANSKYYARIKVLETVIDILEKRIKKHK